MKNIFRIALMLTTLSLLLSSCAKTPEESYNSLEQISLDNWMVLNASKTAQRFDNGLYIEQITPAPDNAEKVEDGDWLEVNFTGSSLSGDVFGTRYEDVARIQGTFTLHTHYTPQKMLMSINTGLSKAEYFALKRMKKGEKVRIYTPSLLYNGAYGRSYSNGYGGQYSLAGNMPAIIDLEVVNIIKDITAYENKEVKTRAAEWGLTEKDTVGFAANLYLKITEESTDPEILKKDKITVDSTFKYFYTGEFLDGYIFDTNITAVANKIWENTSTYKAASYKAANGGLIDAFYFAVKSGKLTYGCKFKMVFPSALAYGVAGNSTGTEPYTVIQPYTPLMFEVEISPREVKDKGDK